MSKTIKLRWMAEVEISVEEYALLRFEQEPVGVLESLEQAAVDWAAQRAGEIAMGLTSEEVRAVAAIERAVSGAGVENIVEWDTDENPLGEG